VFEDPTKQTEIDNFVRRVLINFPMQGSAADLMKKTMVDVDREVLQKDPAIKLLLQIHDELIFEIKDDASYLESTIKKIKDIMSTVYDLVVPMEVEAKMGKSWGDMKPV
jgi:DNA polymerase-1